MTVETGIRNWSGPSNYSNASLRGEALEALRRKFPPRDVPTAWARTSMTANEIFALLSEPPLAAPGKTRYFTRRSGALKVLDWLTTFPGSTWQERWYASPAHELGAGWVNAVPGSVSSSSEDALRTGIVGLAIADVIRPSLKWAAAACRQSGWRAAMALHRDPEGFAELAAHVGPAIWDGHLGFESRTQLAILLFAKGGLIGDITVGDCLQLWETEGHILPSRARTRSLFYAWLRDLGQFPQDSPVTLRAINARAGQVSVEQLVDRYQVQCEPIRDLLVAYLAERQPSMDYTTLEDLSRILVLHFWKNLERHHPGIDSLRLPPEVAIAWKQRIQTKVTQRRMSDGSLAEITGPRANYVYIMANTRSFYLDLAQWAAEDPARWGPWGTPCPIRETDLAIKKERSRRKARMDQRTRERLPSLPLLVRTAEQRLQDAQVRLKALEDSPNGSWFTVLGDTFYKPAKGSVGSSTPVAWVRCRDGRRRNVAQEENRAFWGWAGVEFLRHTGARVEEMLETSHHSLVQYRTPDNGQVIPLLQVAPSKTDEERLLVRQPQSGMFGALSLVVAVAGAGLVASSPV
jgi:hypothetical protein